MVTLRELERGGVAIAFATLFTGPAGYDGRRTLPRPCSEATGSAS